jgi:hypothetical protein
MDELEAYVTSVLRAAIAAVEGAEVPDALRPIAFGKAVDLFAGAATGRSGSGSQQGRAAGSVSPPPDPARRNGGSVVGRIASKLGVAPEIVEDVYANDDEGLRLVVGPAKFESAKRAATMKLALLIAAGYQSAGIEEWTPVARLRDVVKDYNRFDSSNFAVTISKMDDVFLFTGSKAPDRKVKVNRHGYEAAARLVKALTGSDAP